MSNYEKFRAMLPAVARILDLSGAAGEPDAIKDMGYEEEFNGAYTGNLFITMDDEQINDAVEEIYDALESGGILYAKFKDEAQVGEYINEDAGFDVIDVLDDGVICKRRETGSINIFNMMC